MSVQAIAGVSPSVESRVMTEYPSVGATGVGRLIGQIMDCIPFRILGVKLSYLMFGLLLAPLGLLIYLLNRLGSRYILTNRSVQTWSSMGSQRNATLALGEIDSVELDQQPGQSFFRAADIRLKAANGQTLLLLAGVADAAAFRNAILRTREARQQVEASMATIAARK